MCELKTVRISKNTFALKLCWQRKSEFMVDIIMARHLWLQ